MNLVPNKYILLRVPIQSTKCRKKELCVDKKVQETVGDVYCLTCRNKKCVYLSTNKTSSFYDCGNCKSCCHVLNIRFTYQKPTFLWFGGDDTNCFARESKDFKDESLLQKRKAISTSEEICLPITSKHN